MFFNEIPKLTKEPIIPKPYISLPPVHVPFSPKIEVPQITSPIIGKPELYITHGFISTFIVHLNLIAVEHTRCNIFINIAIFVSLLYDAEISFRLGFSINQIIRKIIFIRLIPI